jgi:hypothetical protein
MRKVLIVAIGAAALAGCSKSADHSASGGAAPGAAPSNPVAAAGRMLEPKRKAGLWQMAINTTGGPGMSFTAQMCVDASRAGDFNVKPPASTDCTSSKLHPVAGGWAFASTCKTGDRTITTNGVVTGDLSQNYKMEATTKMDPAPPGMDAVSKTNISARWTGPCPAGMKPGSMKMGGMNLGG